MKEIATELVDSRALYSGVVLAGKKLLTSAYLELADKAVEIFEKNQLNQSADVASFKKRHRKKRPLNKGEVEQGVVKPAEAELEVCSDQGVDSAEKPQLSEQSAEVEVATETGLAQETTEEASSSQAEEAIVLPLAIEEEATSQKVVCNPPEIGTQESLYVWWIDDNDRLQALGEDLSERINRMLRSLKGFRCGGYIIEGSDFTKTELAPRGCNGIIVAEQTKLELVKLELGTFASW